MLWITTILTLIPGIICQSQNGYGFASYDNTNSLSGAHDRISELEKRYVHIEKRWKIDEIRMDDLKKQLLRNQYRTNNLEKQIQADNRRIVDLEKERQADNRRIVDLEKERQADNRRIVDLEKERQADNRRIVDLEKERQADNRRIADLEKERQADKNRIADLEKERQADKNRIADLEKERQADKNRIADIEKGWEADNKPIADLDQQLRVFNHINQGESKTNGSKFDVFKSIEKSNAKQQQHVNFVSKKQRRRDNRQLSLHLKTHEDVIEKVKRVAPENENIAFHAFLTHSYATLNTLMELHFDSIVTNTGSAYDGSTGTFTCPDAGLYVFHWTVHISGGWLMTEVVRNGVQVGTAFSGVTPAGQHTSGGGMTALQLNGGDRVWVRLLGETHGAAILHIHTRFTGFLLR